MSCAEGTEDKWIRSKWSEKERDIQKNFNNDMTYQEKCQVNNTTVVYTKYFINSQLVTTVRQYQQEVSTH